mgnify:CR=1 FL=1
MAKASIPPRPDDKPPEPPEETECFVITIKGVSPVQGAMTEDDLKSFLHASYAINGTLLPFVRSTVAEVKRLKPEDQVSFFRGSSLVLLS